MHQLTTTILILFISICLALSASAQDIITQENLDRNSIELGEAGTINFTVNKITVCDSYTVDIDVSYITKSIVVTVDYNYISSCDNTTFSDFVSQNEQILLEGTYHVSIEVNVPSNPSWNETLHLSSLTVNEPWPKDCEASFVPIFSGLCPIFGSDVCACNGKTYGSECEAYLENDLGNYLHQTCTSYASSEAVDYDCKTYNTFRSDNFLETYDCDDAALGGKEIFLSYSPRLNEEQIIHFSSTRDDVVLFLLKENGNDLTCIAMSDTDSLYHGPLAQGTYYLVSDAAAYHTYEITFCTAVSTSDLSPTQQQCSISPNPARHEVHITSPDKAIAALTLYSTQGEKLKHKVVNGHRYTLPTAGFFGPHILRIRYADNTSENMKIYIEQ